MFFLARRPKRQPLNGYRDYNDTGIVKFVQSRLDDVRRLHNPSSEKTIQLLKDYAGVDLADKWKWNNHDSTTVRTRLNQYIKLRGDVVHAVFAGDAAIVNASSARSLSKTK